MGGEGGGRRGRWEEREVGGGERGGRMDAWWSEREGMLERC